MPKSRRKKYNAAIDWRGFEGEEVILPVCPRSNAVNGRNFLATVEAMKGNVSSINLIHCARLDYHNYLGRLDDPIAQTQKNRDEWREQFLPLLTESFAVREIDWSEIQADPEYARKLDVLSKLYAQGGNATKIIDNTSDHYLYHHEELAIKRGLPFNITDERHRSTQYLIDEFAGTSVYGSYFPDMPEIYWGTFIGDPHAFNKGNNIDRSVDLTLPLTLPVHLNRLQPPQPVGLKAA